MKLKMTSNQSGRTIMEMIAYIMIMVSLTVAVAALAHTGYHRYECSVIQQELTDLKKLIVMRYAADGNYKKIKWNDLRESHMGPRNIMPTHSCTTTCYGQHTFEGKIAIGTDEEYDEYGETFYIEFQELPSDVCIQMGSKQWLSTDGSDLQRIEISNSDEHTKAVWTYENLKKGDEKVLPATVEEVNKICQKGYGNTIRWTFN